MQQREQWRGSSAARSGSAPAVCRPWGRRAVPSSLTLFCSAYPRRPSNRVLPSVDRLLPRASASSVNFGHRPSFGHGPGGRVSRGVEGEDVGERPCGGVRPVNGSPRSHCSRKRGDQRGVPVLVVEHLALGHPRRDDDGRNPVAGTVEREVALARRSCRVGWRHRSGRYVVVGATGFVPADEQRRVPDVGPGRRTASPGRRRRSVTGTPRRPRIDDGGSIPLMSSRVPWPVRRPGGSRRDRRSRHGSMKEKSASSPLAASPSNWANGTKWVANGPSAGGSG